MDVVDNQDCAAFLNCTLDDGKTNSLDSPLFISVMFVGILSLVFNGGVFVLIINVKKIRHNPYHFLVLMLSVSDFTVAFGIMCIGLQHLVPALNRNKLLIVLQIILLSIGLHLSLFQTFYISLQRFLIICTENWNSYVFNENRKYCICIGGWVVVVIINLVLVSPPSREFDPLKDNIMSFVYHGHYSAQRTYNRVLTLSLLSLTIILYIITLVYVLVNHRKNSMTRSNGVDIKTINVEIVHPPSSISRFHTNQKNVTPSPPLEEGPRRLYIESHNRLVTLRRKKAASTLYLVGFLIVVLLIFTGPLIVAMWIDKPKYIGICFCVCILNSLANPFIYMWKLDDVHKFIKSTICCLNRVPQD